MDIVHHDDTVTSDIKPSGQNVWIEPLVCTQFSVASSSKTAHAQVVLDLAKFVCLSDTVCLLDPLDVHKLC